MIKTRYLVSAVAASALVLSTAANAAGFATWPTLKNHGATRSYAYWGPNGARYGTWWPGKYSGGSAWWPGKYSGTYYAPGRVYYGCTNCGGGYYYDDHHHDGHHDNNNDELLWYGLGVATPLLLQGLQNYNYNY